MKRGLAIIFVIALAASGVAIFLFGQRETSNIKNAPQPATRESASQKESSVVDWSANFAVYTNGTVRIFSDAKYHNRSAEVFISADAPNTVQVKKNGVTWQQFFDTMPAPMKVEAACLYTGTGQAFCNNQSSDLKFFLNGKRVNDLLNTPIRDGDDILISYGPIGQDVSLELKDASR